MSTPTASSSSAPIGNRYVTGHDSVGNSVFVAEGALVTSEIPAVPGGRATTAVPWETSFPISLTDATDTANPGNVHLHAANGTTLRVMVVPPGTGSGMHRTATLDYDIIISGEIELELEGGGSRTLKPGDVVVHRGTNHKWFNRSDQPCVFAAVLMSAELPTVNGKQFEATMA